MSESPQLVDRSQLLTVFQLLRLVSSFVSGVDKVRQGSIFRTFPDIENGPYEIGKCHHFDVVSENSWVHYEVAEGVVSESVATKLVPDLFIALAGSRGEFDGQEAIAEDEFQLRRVFLKRNKVRVKYRAGSTIRGSAVLNDMLEKQEMKES